MILTQCRQTNNQSNLERKKFNNKGGNATVKERFSS